MRYVFVFAIVVCISGCELFLDIFFDCIDLDGPEFNENNLPIAILNQQYSTKISAYIENEPNDDWYIYEFNIKGHLPEGLSYYENGDDREIFIIGTPIERGTYSFELEVWVDAPEDYEIPDPDEPYDDGNDLCSTYHKEEFTIQVNVM